MKSRPETASIELGMTSCEAELARRPSRGRCRSSRRRGRRLRAAAGRPPGARRRSASGRGRASRSRRAGGGRGRPAGRAAGGCSRASASRRARRRGRAGPRISARDRGRARPRPASRVYMARSVATWSLRERAVCSRPPTGPAISVSRRSIAMWMSSSSGAKGKRSSAELCFDGVQAGEQRVAILLGDDPLRGEHPRVRTRLGYVLGPEAAVEADRGVQALEVRVLGLVEAGHLGESMGSRLAPPTRCDTQRIGACFSQVSSASIRIRPPITARIRFWRFKPPRGDSFFLAILGDRT